MTKLQTSEFRHATNLLRGFSALSILIWHYQHFFYEGTQRPADWDPSIQPLWSLLKPAYLYGELAVQIFWCISGLILAHTYIGQSMTSLAKFSLARFSRLYPLHLLTLLSVVVIQYVSMQSFSTYQIYSQNDLFHFFTNLFFVQAWGQLGDGFSFNAPTWSVSVEIIVYFMFFAMLTILRRGKIGVSVGAILLLGIFVNTYPTIADSMFFYQCLAYFLTGVSIYFAITSKNWVLRFVLFSMLIFAALFIIPTFRNKFSLGIIILVCISAILDVFPVSQRLRRFRIIGELTYSVFLWHAPLQMIILMIMMQFDISHSIAQSPLFLLFFLALTYSVGYASYRWIEQPARKYINNRFMPAR